MFSHSRAPRGALSFQVYTAGSSGQALKSEHTTVPQPGTAAAENRNPPRQPRMERSSDKANKREKERTKKNCGRTQRGDSHNCQAAFAVLFTKKVFLRAVKKLSGSMRRRYGGSFKGALRIQVASYWEALPATCTHKVILPSL